MIDSGLSPAQLAQPKLTHLAKEIAIREEKITALKDMAVRNANGALGLAIAQGHDLESARKLIPRDLWPEWLENHCPKTVASAPRYMRLAANPPDVLQLDFPSIRETVRHLIERPEPQEKTSWPDYLYGIGRAAKFVNFVQSHPLKQWPDGARNQLRDDLLPVAKELWPDNF